MIEFFRACLIARSLVSKGSTDIEKAAQGQIPVGPAVDLLGSRAEIADIGQSKRLTGDRQRAWEMESILDRADHDRIAHGSGLVIAPHTVEPADRQTGLGHEPVVEGVLASETDREFVSQGRALFGRGIVPRFGEEKRFQKCRVAQVEVHDRVLFVGPIASEPVEVAFADAGNGSFDRDIEPEGRELIDALGVDPGLRNHEQSIRCLVATLLVSNAHVS